jgi:hypothetical protein
MVAWSAIYELTGISAEAPISADEEEAAGGLGDLAVIRPLMSLSCADSDRPLQVAAECRSVDFIAHNRVQY